MSQILYLKVPAIAALAALDTYSIYRLANAHGWRRTSRPQGERHGHAGTYFALADVERDLRMKFSDEQVAQVVARFTIPAALEPNDEEANAVS